MRRVLLVALVLAAATAFLGGCAAMTTPDMVCDIRTDYHIDVPEADEGLVLIKWMYYRDAYLEPGQFGETQCIPPATEHDYRFCIIQMRGGPASYRNVCGLARVHHEEKHAEGAHHEK